MRLYKKALLYDALYKEVLLYDAQCKVVFPYEARYKEVPLHIIQAKNKNKQTPWSESASELYQPSGRRLSAK
jgi:hypothetical protein